MRGTTSAIVALRRFLDRWQPSETVVLGGVAMVVGLASGAGVWIFKMMIELARWLMFDRLGGGLSGLGGWSVALIPVLGGLLVGGISYLMIKSERHHGVTSIMEAVALAGGRLRYWRMPAKAAASALSIGSGASVGPEDPSVQIGASLGSMFGQILRLSDERVRMLVAAGAAAGVSAAFNAPIAGVFFALEIILGELAGRSFSIVVMAAVISAVFTQAVAGAQPAFHVPHYAFNSAWELPLYLGLGILAGPIAALYVRILYAARDFFHDLEVPRWVKPAIAGVAVGLVGIFLPQVFGTGYDTIERIVGGQQMPILLLLGLLLAKMVLTPTSIAGGFLGGVFAPSLFLGAVLGMAFGEAAAMLFPDLGIVPGAFAMVGMAAVLAGAVHAPLTAIILLFEMTNDYRIILPLMFAVVISMVLSQLIQRDSVYTLGLRRAGIRLERGKDLELLERITVQEVMQPDPPRIGEWEPQLVAGEKMVALRRQGLIVVDENGAMTGIVTGQDLDQARVAGEADKPVGEICTREVLTALPEETIAEAMRRMGVRDIGRLPVVDPEDPRRVIGVLRRSEMVRAYDLALARREAHRHMVRAARLGSLGSVEVEEVTAEPGSAIVGRRVREIEWPRDSVIVTIRRGHRVRIPRGDTLLRAGDVLAVAAEEEARKIIARLASRDGNARGVSGEGTGAE